MKRQRMPIGERLALAISAIALLVSIWSLAESRRVASQARWSEFRSNALATLNRHRHTYSQVTCLLHATNRPRGLEEFRRFKSNLDNLESSLHELRGADEAALAKFEALLDASNASFRKLGDAVSEVKSHLAPDELSRVNSICSSADG